MTKKEKIRQEKSFVCVMGAMGADFKVSVKCLASAREQWEQKNTTRKNLRLRHGSNGSRSILRPLRLIYSIYDCFPIYLSSIYRQNHNAYACARERLAAA